MESLRPGLPRYWTPNQDLVSMACEMASGLVVDLGPGSFPLPLANATRIGWGWDDTDITVDRLPFDDGEVDFLYCRHTLEDLLDPCHTLKEIARVAKSGWIEVPSIVSEMTRGVDGGSPPWRGYVHHRSVFWRKGDTLVTSPKYAALEYETFDDLPLAESLQSPEAWNFVFVFSGGLKWKQLRHEVDYHLASRDYAAMIRGALTQTLNEKAPADSAAAKA